jgi:hypothetical protein
MYIHLVLNYEITYIYIYTLYYNIDMKLKTLTSREYPEFIGLRY